MMSPKRLSIWWVRGSSRVKFCSSMAALRSPRNPAFARVSECRKSGPLGQKSGARDDGSYAEAATPPSNLAAYKLGNDPPIRGQKIIVRQFRSPGPHDSFEREVSG